MSLVDQAVVLRMVTGLGDPVFLLSLAATVCVYLWVAGARDAAISWAESLIWCGALVVAAKLAFDTCGLETTALSMRSPSGHTALATTFYGCAAVLLARGRQRLLRFGIVLAAVLVISGVGASRVALGMHSAAEVLVGLVIGFAALALFLARMARNSWAAPPLRWIVALVTGLGLLTHGLHIDFEHAIAGVSQHLHTMAGLCTPEVRPVARQGALEQRRHALLAELGFLR
jgi:membrane-associated phospholipid phosphatase